jgi:hypothetical protein
MKTAGGNFPEPECGKPREFKGKKWNVLKVLNCDEKAKQDAS